MSDASDVADLALALRAYNAQAFVIPFEPVPQGRPRSDRRSGRIYKANTDLDAEAKTRKVFEGAVTGPRLRNVAFGAVFYRSTLRVVDGDNLLKHALDAAKNVLWGDDAQVTAMLAFVEYDPVHPRSVVMLGDCDSSMLRGEAAHPPCRQCGRPVPTERAESATCTVRCQKALADAAQPDLFGA